MVSQAKAEVALACGAAMFALAAGIGSVVLRGNTTLPAQTAAPTSSVAPHPSPITPDRATRNPPECVEPYCGVLLNPPPTRGRNVDAPRSTMRPSAPPFDVRT